MKKWECTVCGYIHEGDEAPDKCPVCGAGKEYFKELTEETISTDQSDKPETAGFDTQEAAAKPSGLAALVMKYHLHPISVHTPNGVLPLGLVFLFLATAFGLGSFEQAAFYSFVFVLLTMPVVIVTGYIEWQNRYKGLKTKIFITKIIASSVVSTALISLVVWRFIDPVVVGSASKWIYLLICLVMVGAAGLAGHMGGKLVFDTRDH